MSDTRPDGDDGEVPQTGMHESQACGGQIVDEADLGSAPSPRQLRTNVDGCGATAGCGARPSAARGVDRAGPCHDRKRWEPTCRPVSEPGHEVEDGLCVAFPDRPRKGFFPASDGSAGSSE